MVNTRHIDKNNLSFDCPDYYDIGKYPSSDGVYESIVALSKQDRKCEIYVMVYRENRFEAIVKRDEILISKNLESQGYEDVYVNRKLPFCFNAHAKKAFGYIGVTIAFNFDYKNVIMVVGNSMPLVHYDFIEDIKIILDSVDYNKNELVNNNTLKTKDTTNKVKKTFDNDFQVKCPKCGKTYHKNRYFSCPHCKSKPKKTKNKHKKTTVASKPKKKNKVIECKCGFKYNQGAHNSCPNCGRSSNPDVLKILILCFVVVLILVILCFIL